MANVKKCDRCGELYGVNNLTGCYGRFNIFDSDREPESNLMTMNYTCTDRYNDICAGNRVDLCERCQDELAEWYFHPSISKRGKANG